MKRVGSWYIPSTEIKKKVTKTVFLNEFTCFKPISAALQYVKRFNKAIDVGAWIGDSTDIISKSFKEVDAFEANPDVYKCLEKNMEFRSNVRTYNLALSNSNAVSNFYQKTSSSFSGWIDTLDDSTLPEDVRQIDISARTLDSFYYKDIDFLKLDVDSHEGFLLEGAEDFFNNNSPVILIEYKPSVLRRQTESMPDPLEILKDLGYKIKGKPTDIDYILIRK